MSVYVFVVLDFFFTCLDVTIAITNSVLMTGERRRSVYQSGSSALDVVRAHIALAACSGLSSRCDPILTMYCIKYHTISIDFTASHQRCFFQLTSLL